MLAGAAVFLTLLLYQKFCQGGILSPHLLNVYVNDHSSLNKSHIECIFNGVTIDHLVHTDDIYCFQSFSVWARKAAENMQNIEQIPRYDFQFSRVCVCMYVCIVQNS